MNVKAKWIGVGSVAVLAFCLALIILVRIWIGLPADPIYQGKKLSESLAGFRGDAIGIDNAPPFGLRVYSVSSPSARDAAVEALSQAGTNAIPLLFQWLRIRESSADPIIELMRRLSASRSGRLSSREKRDVAIVAFYRLGPLAEPYLPRILPLLDDSYHVHAAVLVVHGIGLTREEDVLALTNACNNGYFVTEMLAVAAVGSYGAKARNALPMLISKLTDPSHAVRAAAAVACARVSGPAETVVPLIVRNLQSTNKVFGGVLDPAHADQMNLWALGEFGPSARIALPVISNFVKNPDARINEAARDAIKKISPGNSSQETSAP